VIFKPSRYISRLFVESSFTPYDGFDDGFCDGWYVGIIEGNMIGFDEGCRDRNAVGDIDKDGNDESMFDGWDVGADEGEETGLNEGF